MTFGLGLLILIFEQGVATGPLGSDFFIFGAGGFLILGVGDYFIFERCWVTRPLGAGDFIIFAVWCSAIRPLGVGDIDNYETQGH